MPLHKIEWTADQCGWGLWHITETRESLQRIAGDDVYPDDITNEVKRSEWLAGRVLLRTLIEKSGLSYKGMYKDEFGKPYLKALSHHVSLSHSFPYVAAQVDIRGTVGIDIEQPKSKLLKIAHRVFSIKEAADAGHDLVKNCVYWCAKEALYKIYGLKGLSFISNLKIAPFNLEDHGILTGHIDVGDTHTVVSLRYYVFKDFVLVLTN